MDFYEFSDTLALKLMKKLQGINVVPSVVTKNNGVKLNGLQFMREGVKTSPIIYIDSFYREYQSGKDFEDLVDEVADIYENQIYSGDIDVSFFDDFSHFKDKVYLKVINGTKNEGLKARAPHIVFNDLLIVFFVKIESEDIGTGTVLLLNEHIRGLNVDESDLFKAACKNELNQGTRFLKIEDLLMEILLKNVKPLTPEREAEFKLLTESEAILNFPMYVLTNDSCIFGASKLIFTEEMVKVWEVLKEDFFIIPSSVHELIIIPKIAGMEAGHLRDLICEVNDNEVSPDEILSYNLYEFKKSLGMVSVCG